MLGSPDDRLTRLLGIEHPLLLAPMVALRYVERFVALAHGGLRGALLTLKINDDGIFQALPRLYERIRKMNPSTMRVTQLPSHRSEVVAILTF